MIDSDFVVRALGPLDEVTIAEILDSGASATEILEVSEWLEETDGMARRLGHPSSPRVELVLQLVQDAFDRTDEDDEN